MAVSVEISNTGGGTPFKFHKVKVYETQDATFQKGQTIEVDHSTPLPMPLIPPKFSDA
jgi:hypothetical protein